VAIRDVQPVIVVGAGPAGLGTSAELRRRGVDHMVLERGGEVGYTWANLYDSLRLHTGKHMSHLPGARFPRGTPLFPSRGDFVEYLQSYATRNALPVDLRSCVSAAWRDGDDWRLQTVRGELRARTLVWATGIVSSPRIPAIRGREQFRGRVMHSVEYRRPDGFAGRRVLVVGVGNSGGEIATELARARAKVTIAVRSGANVIPREILGIPMQYLAYLVRKLPRPAQERVVLALRTITEKRRGPPVIPRPAHSALDAIPLIGFHLVDAIREGLIDVRPDVAELTETGARFADDIVADFDDVILATGFSAAVEPLRDLVTVDARGFARRTDRVASADQPRLFFVGHNYDASGGLFNIRVDARDVAARIARSEA
jgi:indole-3-pyruvate monooxygenase